MTHVLTPHVSPPTWSCRLSFCASIVPMWTFSKANSSINWFISPTVFSSCVTVAANKGTGVTVGERRRKRREGG